MGYFFINLVKAFQNVISSSSMSSEDEECTILRQQWPLAFGLLCSRSKCIESVSWPGVTGPYALGDP